MTEDGIWVRLVLTGETTVSGRVSGADSPNDFWATFKSQLVRVDRATEELANGKRADHDVLYVNRDHILTAEVWEGPPR